MLGGRRLTNYLKVMTLEAQTIARACGKNHVHNLEPEDLVALTIEAAAMAQVPLAGTNWIPGKTAISDKYIRRCEFRGDNDGDGSGGGAKERGIKYFMISYTDLFGASAPSWCRRRHQRHGRRRRRLCRLRHLARPDAGPSRPVRDARSGQPDPIAVEDGSRLGRGRPLMDGKLVDQCPRNVLKRLIADAAKEKLRSRPASSASSSS